MAKLYITEYAGLAGGVPIQPALAEQQLTIAAASAKSAAFNASTRAVRLHTDAICSVSLTSDPATANMARMAANQTEYYNVNANGFVTVITNS